MESIFIETENKEQIKAIKAFLKLINVSYKTKKDKKYDPEFVKKIIESSKEADDGKLTTLDVKNLWK
jgi:hypothetical protein